MFESKYYFFEWLEAERINSMQDVLSALEKSKSVELIEKLAQDQNALNIEIEQKNSIVAGTGLDFGSRFTCPNPKCREKIVNDLLHKVWHYFDYVIINDDLRGGIANGGLRESSGFKMLFLSQISALLYIKKIGAESLVRFVQKPNCREHWDKHAIEAGLNTILEQYDTIKQSLIREVNFKREIDDGEEYFVFDHPYNEIKRRWPSETFKDEKNDTAILNFCADRILRELIAFLASDIKTSSACSLPLGSDFPFHQKLLIENQKLSFSDILFNLELPITGQTDISTLLKFRLDNKDLFDRFRDKLRRAAKEIIYSNPVSDPIYLSKEISQDLIDPELRKISSALKSAKKALGKKSALGIFMGTLTTTCGIIAGLPPIGAFAAGLGVTVGATTSAANKFIETQEQIELSDMFFLWKSVDHHDEG